MPWSLGLKPGLLILKPDLVILKADLIHSNRPETINSLGETI